jgi:predicted dehydrogenase
MQAKLQIGILGGGGILGAHAPGFTKAAGRCTVAVVAEANPARDPEIRRLLGPDVRIVRDYHEVLAMPEVIGVDILLPHHLHMPAAIAAAEAGKHVLVEKVMARNVWECDRMIAACEKAGVTLTVCHDRRYHGEWQALKEIVDSGVLGEVFFWKLDHNQNVVLPPTSWAHWKDGIGGGCIMSCLTHQIDGLRWYAGEVEAVTCMTCERPERMQGEFLGVVTAKLKSGALAELSINWWTKSNKGENRLWYEMVQVCGSKGEAYRMDGRGTFVRLHDASDQAAVARYGEAALDGFVKVECGAWGCSPASRRPSSRAAGSAAARWRSPRRRTARRRAAGRSSCPSSRSRGSPWACRRTCKASSPAAPCPITWTRARSARLGKGL